MRVISNEPVCQLMQTGIIGAQGIFQSENWALGCPYLSLERRRGNKLSTQSMDLGSTSIKSYLKVGIYFTHLVR